MKMIIVMLLFLSCCFPALAEEVFQQTDSQGNVIFSDTPLNANAKQLNVGSQKQTSQSNQPMPSNKAVSVTPPSNEISINPAKLEPIMNAANKPHTFFSIASPKDQETLYNQATIYIDIKIDPKLYEGEKIQLLMDGTPVGPPEPSTRFALQYVDRGTHTLTAQLLDRNNQTIKQTDTITIYVHRTSINNMINSPNGAGQSL